MRGRNQALGVCLIGALFPPLQGLFYAVISLVVLRKGMLEAGWVLIWACLPMLGYFAFNLDITPVYALASMVALAYVLKITASWAFTLAALVIFSIVGALIFEASASQLLNDYVGLVFKDLVLKDAEQAYDLFFGMLALGFALNLLVFLILARWWQGELYNPGGFGQEFRALRIPPMFSAVLVGLCLSAYGIGELVRWGQLLVLPLLIAAVALVHWLAKDKGLSRSWLVSFYLLLIFMFQFIMPVLIVAGLMDSWFGLREKFRSDREV
ncbi:MAG: hypothetical protein KUG79_01410 [Pseudomonadales bacterium]|nr:hypothetical protein [Pseudomonadales bacterium]